MARQTNGTDQSLQTASSLDLTGQALLSIQMWLWWDTFASDDDLAMEFSTDHNSFNDGFVVNPNVSDVARFQFGYHNAAGQNQKSFTRPSEDAWHHYVFNFDRTLTAAAEIVSAYVDGSSQSLTTDFSNDSANNFGNHVLYLMSRANSTLFGAGRIAEVAIWGGVNLSQGNVDTLYNSGKGARAQWVQGSNLRHYWRLEGNSSPEPASVGGIAMTVNGATQVAHPFTLKEGPLVTNRWSW